MESILSMHDEVYPLKSRRNKSSYLSNSISIRQNHLSNKTNLLSLIYQYIKKMIAQRTLYILGIFNLILAAIAILCVTHAEDHPEYFSLVYISVSIFIFYMITILFIIILQIIEAYQEQYQRNQSLASIQIPTTITPQSNPIIVQSMTTKTQPKIILSRSQTLPIASNVRNSSPTTARLDLSPKNSQLIQNFSTKNYQSFAVTTHNPLSSTYTTLTHTDHNPYLSPLIKPIPLKYQSNRENNKYKNKISEY